MFAAGRCARTKIINSMLEQNEAHMHGNPFWISHKNSTARLLRLIRLHLMDEGEETMKTLNEIAAEMAASEAAINALQVAGPNHVLVDPAAQTVVNNADIAVVEGLSEKIKAAIAAKSPAPEAATDPAPSGPLPS